MSTTQPSPTESRKRKLSMSASTSIEIEILNSAIEKWKQYAEKLESERLQHTGNEEKILVLEDMIAKLQAINAELHANNEVEKAQHLAEMGLIVDEYNTKIKAIEDEKLQQIGCSQQKIMKLEDTVAKLQAINGELHAKKEQEKNRHQAELEAIIAEYNTKIKALEAEKLQRIKNEDKILKLGDTVNKLQTMYAESLAKNDREKSQHQAEMKSLIDEYAAKIEVLENEKKESEATIKLECINNLCNEEKILELQDTVTRLQAMNAELCAKNEQEKNRYEAEMELILNEHATKIKTFEDEKLQHFNDRSNEDKILKLEATVAMLQSIIAENEDEKSQLKADMDSAISEFTAKIQVFEVEKHEAESKIKELTVVNASMKIIKSEIKDSAENEREAFQSEKDKLKAEVVELRNQIEAYDEEKQRSVEKILEMIDQLPTLDSNMEENVHPVTVQSATNNTLVRGNATTILLGFMTRPEFYHTIKMKPNDRFDKIYLDYGAQAGYAKPEDLILIWDTGAEYRSVKYFDTPAKLKMPLNASVSLYFLPKQTGEIKIQINMKNQKNTFERFIHKTMSFGKFKIKLCAELKIEHSKVRFSFGNKKVRDGDTPRYLDMKDFDCLDVLYSEES